MSIKTINCFLFLCFIHSIGLQAQNSQEDLLKAAQKTGVDSKSVQPLSDLIASGQLTERRVLAMAYSCIGYLNLALFLHLLSN